MSILEIQGLVKKFGNHTVIDDIDFSVEEGRIFGFLGQNGAGKTTTMKMVLGLLKPDAGVIRVCGETVIFGESKTNRHVGYLPDVPEFYSYMKPSEYLKLCGEISGIHSEIIQNKSKELLELVGLDSAKRRIGGFSRGMKQRLGIAQALINEPHLLICDEPTSALDPVGRKEILDILKALKGKTTVIFSTHILSDVERICDEICVLHNGKLGLQGSLQQLKASHRKDGMMLVFQNEVECISFTQRIQNLHLGEINSDHRNNKVNGNNTLTGNNSVTMNNKVTGNNTLEIYNSDINGLYTKLLKEITDAGLHPTRIEIIEPTIENLFMEVVR